MTTLKRLLSGLFLSALLISGCAETPDSPDQAQPPQSASLDAPSISPVTQVDQDLASSIDLPSDELFSQAFEAQSEGVQLSGRGEVIAVLPDDNQGSRHQKFIVRLSSGQTLLVAHNIDLAPRVPDLQKGDQVSFYGEYVWTPKGGVMHWTHHDPAARHQDGWIEKDGVRYG